MTSYALLFPGQGSQQLGMLEPFLSEPIFVSALDEASSILAYDLLALCQNGPEATLNQTEYTQAVLLATGVALYRVLEKRVNRLPTYLAGHSLGEYTALCCAGVISFEEALKLVQTRGRLMQAAVPLGEGAMAAIVGLTPAQVQKLCLQISSESKLPLSAANFNADVQVVVAGAAAAIELAIPAALAQGAKIAKKLAMSVPSHCEMLKEASLKLKAYMDNLSFSSPKIPVIQNVDVAIHTNPAEIKQALVDQLYQAVRWTETMAKLSHLGIQQAYEVAPGKVLSGLCKRIEGAPACASMTNLAELEKMMSEVNV